MSDKIEGHILHCYDEELQSLRGRITEMGDLVLRQLCQSLESLRKADRALAELVIQRERDVNKLEVATDNEIFKILAKRCPVASDLRFVMAASKIINNLERIGDEAAKLGNFVLGLHTHNGHGPGECPFEDVYAVGELAISTLCHALQAVAESDVVKAKEVSKSHSGLDHRFRISLNRLMSRPQLDGDHMGDSVSVTLMLKALERVGDHAQNLAECIIFQVEGEDVRHRIADFDQGDVPAIRGDGQVLLQDRGIERTDS